MIVLGLIILLGSLTYVLTSFSESSEGFRIFVTVMVVLFLFFICTEIGIDPPNSPENLEQISSCELETVYMEGHYYVFNNGKFEEVFDKELLSYVTHDPETETIQVYREKYKKPNLWWLSFADFNDYTYYKIVLAE